ncbi:MAG TPA: hypothetical protein PLC04_07725 [Candidatus Kapabacteria bacterium]|nr:hypothetical protein [Candidatus Kapabacteria bacterium]HOV92947.1 hypothetical protein [Candidatus Kapabacteria bacterium]
MRKIIILIVLMFLPLSAFAFQGANVTLLQGTVKDKSGNPIGTDLKFINSDAKPFSLKSNSKDGNYQQPLVQGEKYYPIFKGYILENGFEYFELANVGKYNEGKRDFIVKPLEPNMLIAEKKLFKDGDTLLSQDAIEFLKIFKSFFILNKNLIFRISISAPDVAFKQTTRKIKVKVKNKNTTKTVKVSAKELEAEFIQARIDQLSLTLKELEMPLTVINFEKKIKANPSKKLSKSNDFELYIKEIKNL